MTYALLWYIGFTMGLCFMDYIDVKNDVDIHLYRYSIFHIAVSLITAPITFPFYLLLVIKDKVKERYL